MFKSISKLAALVIFAATFLSSPIAAHATGCSLSGQGTQSDPWQVGTAEQFQQIGDGACTKDGFYLQTNDITLTTPTADITSTGSLASGFSGTYDGDFYTITLSGGWGDGTYSSPYGLFGGNLSGTIKKLNLTGEYKTSSFWGQPLVLNMNSGAIVSQVSSDVNVTVTGNLDTVKLGGLVQRLGRGATIEYSRASGTLSWEPSSGSLSRNLYYGGLVTEAGMDQNGLGSDGPSTSEIRDSYASVTFKWPDGAQCTSTTGVTTGGLVGLQTTVSGDLYVVRSYSTSKLGTGVQTTNTGCRYASMFPAVGGLVGRSDADKYLAFADVHVPTYLYFVSSFWAKDLIEGQQNSVGLPRGGSTGQYVNGLPGAVGLDSSSLKSITTYQSHEGSTPGLPGSSSDLTIGSSSGSYPSGGTPLSDASTYRWAMEQGNLTTFIPSEYTDIRNFTTRGVIADTTVSRSMEGQGQASLEGPVQNYPQLGRVWEICSQDNSGFPVLVWERKCTPTSVDPTPSPTTSPEPGTTQGELASTGANILWLIFAGLLTTIAGFGFSVYSRRKRV